MLSKLYSVLSKNPGLQTIVKIGDVLSNKKTDLDLPPNLLAALKYAPVTSCELLELLPVERLLDIGRKKRATSSKFFLVPRFEFLPCTFGSVCWRVSFWIDQVDGAIDSQMLVFLGQCFDLNVTTVKQEEQKNKVGTGALKFKQYWVEE